MYIMNTLSPYKPLPRGGIQYSTCTDYDHISRNRGQRQIIYNPNITEDRFISMEMLQGIPENDLDFTWHEVTPEEENRTDLVAYKYLGSASYGWVICYYNNILDGFTLRVGQKIRIPDAISSLMTTGNLLQTVTALQLNLGSED